MNKRSQIHNFQGRKLKTARIIRGFTLEELGEKLGVSHQSVSKYENDKASPDIETARQLAEILQFTPSFFYGNSEDLLNAQSTHFFRSGAAVAKKYKEQVKEKVCTLAYLIRFIETNIKLPEFKIPNFISVQSTFKQIDFEEIDNIAEKMRRYVGLGDGPISNITALCERLGIIVAFAKMDNEKIDACTVVYNNRPYILLNEERLSSVRLRFNIAHEMGHLLLHSSYVERDVNDRSKHKRIEQEANRFASAFLMPESTIVPELSSSGLDYLLILKEHWKVSVQAIIYRAEELGVYTQDYALYLRQQISRKKWRLVEPLDENIPIEKPSLFKQALNLIINKCNITLEEISFQTGLTIQELSIICDLKVDPLNNECALVEKNVVKFPLSGT
ncbi:XRE family transcriptional regulator [Bacillus wiedmannii]|uniref:ImmA/IrrE family metallo-endopeptidase n=1 Tax=Bacillus cereus TaxID=1396 RepID=A0A9W7Q7K0_BACCE|nr:MULTISPECIES: XRE family transcriptional regulator [Bacillus]KAA6471599.1 ImmA/IrrE family metallo-endopeptidase [Bacillus cereus]KAB2502896.1 ImmA/IrrE family metallo-endopeptidase [Bacillus cereus]MCU5110004.1 XRE family transcriptional regulator [Bacillus wiedmannii]MCU5149678.1 XRE family transcriptional regulator [Bacillus wiedmannii]SEG01778.1 Zn-dependent peptidase ImmA, M78 family [Bacillus sp. ok061]